MTASGRTTHRRLGATSLLVALIAGLLGVVARPDVAVAESVEIPVLGSTTIQQSRDASRPRAIALVHGVRRIQHGTVLYYSMGYPENTPEGQIHFNSLLTPFGNRERYSPWGVGTYARQKLFDVTGRKVYTTLVTARNGDALSSDHDAAEDRAGVFFVFFVVFPEMPATTTHVDVRLGDGDLVQDVPVEDGVLTPTVTAKGPIELGTGWPTIDEQKVAAAYDPAGGIYPMTVAVSDLEQAVTTREQTKSVSVDLSADVLFAVDKATLTAAARAKLAEAAATVNARAMGGTLQIVGHTDNTGTTTHNLDLSKRRAQAVADALRPLITVPGVTFSVSGRGESEPVEDNRTAEGRRANRRVSIVFTPKGS